MIASLKDNKRNSTLDVLRGVAVLLVMFHHIKLINKDAFTNPLLKTARYSLTPLVRGGWIGVDLFFILSGFLVSGLLFTEFKHTAAFQPGKFLIRRGFKLYPSLFFFLLVTILFERAYCNYTHTPYFPITYYIRDLFFLENYFKGRFTHTWSLDVEEFFYLFLTLFFVVAVKYRKMNVKSFAWAYIVLLIISFTGRIISISQSATDNSFYLKTHTRMDALFFGVLLSYVYHFERERFNVVKKNKKWILPVVVLLLIPNFIVGWTNTYILLFTLTTNSFCFGMLLIMALDSKLPIFRLKPLIYIGRYSYSIYLWHVFINIYLLKFILATEWDGPNGTITSVRGWLIYLAVYFVLSIFTGALFTQLIENPFLRSRDKYFPSKNRMVINTQAAA